MQYREYEDVWDEDDIDDDELGYPLREFASFDNDFYEQPSGLGYFDEEDSEGYDPENMYG